MTESEWSVDKAMELAGKCELAYSNWYEGDGDSDDAQRLFDAMKRAREALRANLSLRAVPAGDVAEPVLRVQEITLSADQRASLTVTSDVSIPGAATPPDREALRLAKDALTEISAMYAHTWDRADDGALVMLPLSIPRFEAAHEKVLTALAAINAALEAK